MTFRVAVALLAGFALPRFLAAGGATPEPASTRAAFEAMYPKTSTTAAALELERLAASIGVDLARAEEKEPKHDHPTSEAIRAYATLIPAIAGFLDRELKSVDERVGVPPPALVAFLEENDPVLESIRSATSGDREIAWDLDVTLRQQASPQNLLGQLRLQRLLVARALVQTQRGDVEPALQTLEASWRLLDALSARPELISQLLAVAAARLQAGALRKIDSPAYGWSDRLRSSRPLDGLAAVIANEVWLGESDISGLTGEDGGFGRMWRRVRDALVGSDPCVWTSGGLRKIVEEAAIAEMSDEMTLTADSFPNLINAFERARRVMIDQELTALVLDARAERAASRRRSWPGKLTTLGASICPREPWSYKTFRNGTVTISFGGRAEETEVVGVRLPFTANAGIPVASARKPPRRPLARKAEGEQPAVKAPGVPP